MSNDRRAVTSNYAVPSRRMDELPQYNVILLNDAVNEFSLVVSRICELTPLSKDDAVAKTTEAHKIGQAVLLTTHKERAELYQQQFSSLRPPIAIAIEEMQR